MCVFCYALFCFIICNNLNLKLKKNRTTVQDIQSETFAPWLWEVNVTWPLWPLRGCTQCICMLLRIISSVLCCSFICMARVSKLKKRFYRFNGLSVASSRVKHPLSVIAAQCCLQRITFLCLCRKRWRWIRRCPMNTNRQRALCRGECRRVCWCWWRQVGGDVLGSKRRTLTFFRVCKHSLIKLWLSAWSPGFTYALQKVGTVGLFCSTLNARGQNLQGQINTRQLCFSLVLLLRRSRRVSVPFSLLKQQSLCQ